MVQLGDVGVDIIVQFLDSDCDPKDISSFTTLSICFEKTDGTTVSKTATFTTDGTDGKIQYLTETGVIDQTGTWRLQGVISKVGAEWRTPIDNLTVGPALSC